MKTPKIAPIIQTAMCRRCGSIWDEHRDLGSLEQCLYCRELNTEKDWIIAAATDRRGGGIKKFLRDLVPWIVLAVMAVLLFKENGAYDRGFKAGVNYAIQPFKDGK